MTVPELAWSDSDEGKERESTITYIGGLQKEDNFYLESSS